MSKSPPWESLLLRKGNKPGGRIETCAPNAATIFSHDPEWRGVLAFDEFVGDIVMLKEPPWPTDVAPDRVDVGVWTEADTRLSNLWLTRKYEVPFKAYDAGEGLHIAARRTIRHPLRDWLNALKWDRKPRVDSFLVRLAGADDNVYVREVSKNFLVGAVARVMCPGAKVDTMPILEGGQGIGKSTLIHDLVGEEFYLESTIDIGHKDGYQVLRRKWVVELGELDSLNKSEVSRVKQFLSQRVDTYRPSYGHRPVDFPRQQVFIGTINPDGGGYLKDETGARRFQPVHCRGVRGGRVDLVGLKAEREQLWAEAVFRYRRCEKWHITDDRIIAHARAEAESRRETHPWEHLVAEWLDVTYKASRFARTHGVTTKDVLTDCIGKPVDQLTRPDQMAAARILVLCGWSDVWRDDTTPGRPRYYRKPGSVQLVDEVSVPLKDVSRDVSRRGGPPTSSGLNKKPAS